MATELLVNGRKVTVDVPPSMPLLWALRDVLGMTGTKYGCGIGACGSCTVLVDGKATRSCLQPVESLAGKAITTIEGLATGDALHPAQQAWVECSVPQCGWCQPAQVLTAASLMAQDPRPDAAAVDRAMDGVLCRCGTQQRIRAALKRCLGS
ncbi:MAG: hypothetical protein RL148_1406 [Planctomycetota bacterium]|jgi:isoquinoline 1-oxidoreductase alpha subunit